MPRRAHHPTVTVTTRLGRRNAHRLLVELGRYRRRPSAKGVIRRLLQRVRDRAVRLIGRQRQMMRSLVLARHDRRQPPVQRTPRERVERLVRSSGK